MVLMEPRKRILINTTAQYAKAFINICLSLYTVPIILDALGEDDYGVYSLIAGIVAMLAFVTNAMVVTTQRHLSFHIGRDDNTATRKMFSNSVLMHIVVGLVLGVVILAFRNLFVSGLKIDDVRRPIAGIVYIMSVTMIFISFITAPFKAVLIAHENIVFISIIEVLDGVIKLVLTLLLINMDVDKLLIYSYMMTSVFAFELIIYSIYALGKFKECQIKRFISDLNINYIKELGAFAGWTTFGMGAVIGRTQGISILLNIFHGTVANAAYGIATHLYSAVSFVSTSVVNAMNPQIMQAEGRKERDTMISLAEQESKILFILMTLVFIPLIIEMDCILDTWLHGKVPENTVIMCQCLLAAFIVDQTTYGLLSANQATGKIKWFTIIMYTPKLLFVGVVWILFFLECSITWAMVAFVVVELIMALARIPYQHYAIGLNASLFIKNVMGRVTILIIVIIGAGLLMKYYINVNLRFLITVPLTIIIGCATIWTLVLNNNEKTVLKDLILSKTKK